MNIDVKQMFIKRVNTFELFIYNNNIKVREYTVNEIYIE